MDLYEKHQSATQAILDEKFKKGDIGNLYIPEVLEGISEIQGTKERVKALQNNSDRSLNTILLYTFADNRPRLTIKDINSIKYRAAYSGDDISISSSTLYDVAKRFYIFYRTDLPVDAMKKIAMEIMENLHPIEVDVFKGIFAGKMPYKGITKNLVKSAFPDLFPEEETHDNEDRGPEIESKPDAEDVDPNESAQLASPEAITKMIGQPEEASKNLTPAEKRRATIARKKAEKVKEEAK